MKEIILKDGTITIVDDQDFMFLNAWNWQKTPWGNYVYRRERIKRDGKWRHKSIYMHNVIMGVPANKHVDHRDRNGLNNQRNNLRICAWSENLRNKSKRKDSQNQYKGTIRSSNGKRRWRAQIKVGGKRYRSECFLTEAEAAMAYNEMAILYHGEYACLNII